jgi:uncharacterized membrane protein
LGRAQTVAPVVLTVVVCVVTLSAGWLLKSGCLGPWDGRQYRRLCYNDVQPLYTGRHIDRHTFPYVHGRLVDGELRDGAIEYPVGTGLWMWATGYLATSSNMYLVASAVALVPFALLVAVLLARLAGPRALMWAAAPALSLYAFHNWDLLAVAASVGAFYAARRDRPVWAGALLGLGGALKLFPMLFLVPLALDRARRSRREVALVVLSAAVVSVGVNLPFAAVNPEGWLATYRFHALRGADFNSIWQWGWQALSPQTLNPLAAGLTVATCGVAVVAGLRRARREGTYPYLQVCGATLAAFLLWSKVHSPQYALWILPFFVLLEVPLLWWAAYSLVDLALYTAIFRWFYDLEYVGVADTGARSVLIAGVWGRAALLAMLFVVFLRARVAATTGNRMHRPIVSHALSNVSSTGGGSSARA